jgi:hypothetical protein
MIGSSVYSGIELMFIIHSKEVPAAIFSLGYLLENKVKLLGMKNSYPGPCHPESWVGW